MADNSNAKSHLDQVETKLNRIDDVNSINAVIAARTLDLFRNLSSKNFFIDEDVRSRLATVRNQLDSGLVTDANARIGELSTELAGLAPVAGNNTRRAEIGREISDLHRIVDAAGNRMTGVTNRFNEYDSLLRYANYFNLSTNLTDLDINTSTAPVSGTTTVSLAPFLNPGAPAPTTYNLCDEQGNTLTKTGGNYKLNIGGQEYTLGGVNVVGGNLDCTAMTITPALKDSPIEITLSINAVYPDTAVGVSGVNVVCNKKLKLKLNDGTMPLDNPARGIEFDNYNSSLPVGHKIFDVIQTDFETNRYKIERKVLEKILKKNGGIKYDTLNEKQKEEFYQKIRTERIGGMLYFDNIYDVENISNPGDMYNEYRRWFIDDKRDWNKGDNIKNGPKYVALIHNTIEEKIQDFISNKLEHFMGSPTQDTRLKSELTVFLGDIEKNRLDSDVNNGIDSDVSLNSHKMDKGPRSLLHNRDTNYMRFFSGSSTSIKGQVVDIHTNTDPESIDNPEPVKYDMDVNITGKNNISVEIKIEGTNEIIKHKSGEPSALIRKIMRDQRIKYGKARAHMGFNLYKAMVQMAKEKDISLQYRDGSDHTRFIDVENGNIVVRQVDNLTTLNKEEGTVIFDQEKFTNMNEFDRFGYNGALRQGLDNLGAHFNLAMNQLHRQYRQGVERRFLKIFSSPSRMTLPTSVRLSPIKKLLNLRNTTNFDFSTNIVAGGKNISVDFKKNKFTINMEGLKKPISSKDLGKLLNHREKRVRVFDGIERDLVAGIYSTLIEKLRQNANIARTDFGVKDDITGNMYVLDQDGEFGWIAKEDLDTYDTPMTGISQRRRNNKEFGMLNQTRLSGITVHKMSESEQKELMKNPFIMQKFVKAMNRRMGLRNTMRAAFWK